jgi:L-lactate dehydrogenase complex protein LldE
MIKIDKVLIMRVKMFVPCLVDQFHPMVAESTLHVLKRVGAVVEYADEVICCGQPFFKAGYWKKTLPMAKKTITALEEAEYVVAPSGSCVSMMRHHYLDLLKGSPFWLQKAERLSQRIYELSEFLIHVAAMEDLGASFHGKVTYHDSCQVFRALGVSHEPRRLLQKVQGLELVEMKDSDRCCGFGGIFSFKYPHIAAAIGEEKVNNIIATGVETVVGCEISCLMHIGGLLKKKGIPIRTIHIAEILATC